MGWGESMSAAGWWLVVGGAIAIVDWWAVGTSRRAVEYVAKPATMLPLIAAAVVLEPVDSTMRWWFVAGLVLSLAGDVFLMLPREELFVAGLGAFLLAHVCYIVGFVAGGVSALVMAITLVPLGLFVGAVAPIVVTSARRHDARLAVPVSVYVAVISAMVVAAFGAGSAAGIVGALLFYLSDLTIGWSRFVRNFPSARLVIMVTYHAAQVLLVLSLLG